MSPQKGGAAYRKISTQMWGDEKFRKLSRPRPNAQSLWQWLLTGPKSTNVPGLIHSANVAQIASAIGWSVAATKSKLREIEDAGMAVVDNEAGVVWIPKAVRHNEPSNPNQAAGWAATLHREYPECDLVRTAVAEIRAFLGQISEEYRRSFDKRLAQLLGRRSWNGILYDSGLRDQDQRSDNRQQTTEDQKEEYTQRPAEPEPEVGPAGAGAAAEVVAEPLLFNAEAVEDQNPSHGVVQSAWEQRFDDKISRWTEHRSAALERFWGVLGGFGPRGDLSLLLERYFDALSASSFCRGDNRTGWTVTLNWAIGADRKYGKQIPKHELEERIRKAFDGEYADKDRPPQAPQNPTAAERSFAGVRRLLEKARDSPDESAELVPHALLESIARKGPTSG